MRCTLGEPFSTLPFVRPGGELLLRLDGWPKVQQVLLAIDAVEAAGVDPCDAAAGSTGATSTTGLWRAWSRGPIRGSAIRHGSSAGRCSHDPVRLCDARLSGVDGDDRDCVPGPVAAPDLERQPQRADRPLRGTAGP